MKTLAYFALVLSLFAAIFCTGDFLVMWLTDSLTPISWVNLFLGILNAFLFVGNLEFYR